MTIEAAYTPHRDSYLLRKSRPYRGHSTSMADFMDGGLSPSEHVQVPRPEGKKRYGMTAVSIYQGSHQATYAAGPARRNSSLHSHQ